MHENPIPAIAPEEPAPGVTSSWKDPRHLAGLAAVVIGVAIMVRPAMVASFHCDETTVLRHVTMFGDGNLRNPGRPGLLWLLMVPLLWLGDPAVIALVARGTAVLASVATLWLTWRLATRPADLDGRGIAPEDRGWSGVVAVLLLAMSMSWQAHSFEIRTDTYVVPVTLLAMHLLWRDRLSLRRAALVGALVAVGGLFSQKTIYNAAGMGLGWLVFVASARADWRWRERLRVVAVAVGVALGLVVLWYGFLELYNDFAAEQWKGAASTNISRAAANAFHNPRSIKTNLNAWGKAVIRARALYWLLPVGVLWALARARREPRGPAMLAVGLVMAATIFVHRGFFMYFIASFEPYLAVLAGLGVGGILSMAHSRGGRAGAGVAGLALACIVGFAATEAQPHWESLVATDNEPQLRLMRDVREAFPEPTPYWDAIGLIPGYPETTFFGTGATRRRMRVREGNKGFVKLARRKKPLFFIHDYMTRDKYLRGYERKWLWRHFVPYRPNLYLRGGRLRVAKGEEKSLQVEVVQGGTYTVWFLGSWKGDASVNGRPVGHKEQIELEPGKTTLRAFARSGDGQFWIIYGPDREPAIQWPGQQIDYSMFPLLTRERYQQYDRPRKRADLRTPDHDPRIGRYNTKKRHRRHRDFQRDHDRKMAQP